MDDLEKIQHLTAALDEPEGKYTHDQIRQRLVQLHGAREVTSAQNWQPPGGAEPVNIQSQPVPETPGGFARRVGGEVEDQAGVAVRLGHRAANAATFGAFDTGLNAIDRAAGTHFGVPQEQQDADRAEHPWLTGTADAIGYMAPTGAPAKAGEAIGRGVDALTGAIAKRGLAARLAARAAGGAATGAGTGAIVQGAESASRGESLPQIGRAALSGAETGAEFGAPMGFAAGAAGEGARAARESSPDLSILHKYGLEPGPVPGRPVIRQDSSIASQLPGISDPALGVSRATPATRGAASRAAADVIVPDMAERSHANNQRFGEMRGDVVAREGSNPAHVTPALQLIDQHMSDPGMPDTTRAALGKLRERIINQSTPTRVGIFTRADDLDRLRDYADSLGRQERAARASDVPLRQVADVMRDGVNTAAPGLAALNAQQAEVLSGFEQRRATLGVPRPSERGSATSEKTLQSVAGKIQQSGEETATGGRSTVGGKTRSERLAELGAPPTLPGTQVPPEPGYGTFLDKPRLQLAQENLQLTPSKVFSGAGQPVTSGAGVAHRLAHAAPTRLLYPLARRAGEATVGSKPLAADALIQALRGRRDKSMTNWQTDEGAP